MSPAVAAPPGLLRKVYRGFLVVAAIFLLFWIGFSGLVAVSKNPYMIPAFWFLGVLGLMGCVVACLNALPGGTEEKPKPPRLGRATAFLAVAVIAGGLLWSQGRPSVDGSGPEFAVVGVLLVIVAFLGLAGLVVLPVLYWLSPEEEAEEPQMVPQQ